ncbi:COP9 signalosome complex subunit 3-like [Tropilaelaps mercedesae]|uniref:COP9 signalosome complex subunit 3 n=1 Tax=Tropilaelaps mercedesae TaxID=418985 RepID=A0A1V9Y310_9ACAR|nr:COP9 signalosome complex subunit 3-like [Tropilaelaps mercedesae]
MNPLIEQFVVSVQEFSAQGKFQELNEILIMSQILDTTQISLSALDLALETLNSHRHTLGVIYILSAKHAHLRFSDDYTDLFRQSKELVMEANPEQLPHASDQFIELCHQVTVQLVERQCPMKGIHLLQVAIGKLQTAPSQLTALHADLCQLCLRAKCPQAALKILDADITDVFKEKGPNAKYFLLYFYYGGMIYTALKKFERALFFFEAAVTVDSMVVSHIVLEAYKKRILVSLIAHGKVEPLPSWTSSVVDRFARQLSKCYHDLEAAYGSSSVAQVRDLCQKNSERFARDGNTGLVKQCVTALTRKNIKKLTKTFLTLSLADVAQRCELASAREAERQLFNMIEDGEIFASINQKDGMVKFMDNPNKFNNANCFLELEEKMRRYMEVNEKVRQLSEEIALDPKFILRSSAHDDEMAGPTVSVNFGRKLPSTLNRLVREVNSSGSRGSAS